MRQPNGAWTPLNKGLVRNQLRQIQDQIYLACSFWERLVLGQRRRLRFTCRAEAPPRRIHSSPKEGNAPASQGDQGKEKKATKTSYSLQRVSLCQGCFFPF